MALSLGIYNLGIITNMKDDHKNDISMNLSLENDGTSFVGPFGRPGEGEPK